MNAYEQGNDVMLDVARYDHLWVNGSSDFQIRGEVFLQRVLQGDLAIITLIPGSLNSIAFVTLTARKNKTEAVT